MDTAQPHSWKQKKALIIVNPRPAALKSRGVRPSPVAGTGQDVHTHSLGDLQARPGPQTCENVTEEQPEGPEGKKAPRNGRRDSAGTWKSVLSSILSQAVLSLSLFLPLSKLATFCVPRPAPT